MWVNSIFEHMWDSAAGIFKNISHVHNVTGFQYNFHEIHCAEIVKMYFIKEDSS